MSDVLTRLNAALSDRYRVERQLGEGGMATVFLARDLRHDRDVALKVLKPELGIGPERFLEEIRITARLQHPHIVPLHDSGAADGLLFYVMPFVEGETLRERLSRKGRLAPGEARRILGEIADALSAAHAVGVIHRDIKPANILLTGGHALVADFGIGRAVSAARSGGLRLTTVGTSLGTPSYMSPEQAAGDEEVDQRSDIYAAGVVAYEMLTGRPPFGGGPRAVAMAHLTRAPEPFDDDTVARDPALAAAVMRCLAKAPSDRWTSAGDLVEALRQDPASGKVEQSDTDVRLGSIRAIAVLVTVGVILAGAWVLRNRSATLPRTVESGTDSRSAPIRILVLPAEPGEGVEPRPVLGGQLSEAMRRGMSQYSDASIVSEVELRQVMEEGRGTPTASDIAARTDADFVIAGRYGALRDEITLSLDVLRSDGTLFRTLAPLSANADAAELLVDRAERVTASLSMALTLSDPRFATYLRMPEHPETARLWIRAVEESNREQRAQAIEFLYQVIEREPEWPGGYLQIRPSLMDSGRGAEWATLRERFLPLVPTLNRGERAEWQFHEGETDDIRLGGAIALYDLFDGDGLTAYLVAFRALSRNRLALARAHMDSLDWVDPSVREWAPAWILDTKLYHLLEEPEFELARAEEGRARFPQDHRIMRDEIRAHIGLGAPQRAEALVDAVIERPLPAEEVWRVLHESALEFLAHDFDEPGARTLRQLAMWSSGHPEMGPYPLGHALYDSGRFEEALPHLKAATDDAALEDLGGLARMERLAVLAMTLESVGRPDDADVAAKRLPEFDPGRGSLLTLWAAAMRARRNDVEGTVVLLRTALDAGMRYWDSSDALRDEFLHVRPEFSPVRDSPQFVQLLEPIEGPAPGR